MKVAGVDDAYRLARARALRVVPAAGEPGGRAGLDAIARPLGRRVMEVQSGDGGRGLTVCWPEESDPAGGAAAELELHRTGSPSILLTMAACVRGCWPDPTFPLYPGIPADVEAIHAAVAAFRSLAPKVPSGFGLSASSRGAVRTLRVCGLLADDGGDRMVRLGPQVALWSRADVAVLRECHDRLPYVGRDPR